MGFEILTQPQVFRVKLSALGGIEGYIPPYISSFYTWTITTPASPLTATTFNIVGGPGLNHVTEGSYIVNISGNIIPPPEYDVDPNFRTITFDTPLSANTTFYLTQIGTIALSTANYLELTGVNFFSRDSRITNLSSEQITVNANSTTDAVRIIQTGTGNALYVGDSTYPDATPFVITSAGNVGIGLTNPTAKLHVDGIVQTGNRIFMDGDGADFRWIGNQGTASDSDRVAICIGSDSSGTGIVNFLAFNTSSAGRMYINDLGNIGIGTTLAGIGSRLHVQGGNNKILQTTTDSTSPIFQQNFSSSYIDSATKVDVLDPVSPAFLDNFRSHTIEFRRRVPARPVNYWLTNSPSVTSTFLLAGGPELQSQSQSYIVTVGGNIQPHTTYTINPTTRQITFDSNVPQNADVYVLQTLNPAFSAAYNSVTTQSISSSPNSTTTFPLSNLASPLTDVLGQYVVGVNGVYQIPNDPPYTITPASSTITFATNIPANLLVTVTRIPSAVSFSGPAQEACFLGTFFTWATAVSSSVSELSLAAGPTSLLSDKNSYIVNIGGILQTPITYDINPRTRKIIFDTPISGSNSNPISVAVTQLAAPEMAIKYSTVLGLGEDCYNENTGVIDEVATIRPGLFTVNGNISATGGAFGTNVPANFYLSGNRGALTVTSTVPYFDTANALILAPNKAYEIDYDVYFNTTTGTSLRYVLSANNNPTNVVANHITTQSGAGGIATTGNAQIGGVTAQTTIPILLPPFTITAGVTAYSQIKCLVETLDNNTTFVLGISGNNGTVTPLRGSKRTSSLLN
jgi:hypothetical protein